MTIDPLTSIEQLTAEQPQTRRLLCRIGVDVLADGDLTLRDAALRQGIPVQDAIRGLAAAGAPEPVPVAAAQDWLKMPKSRLLDHIVDHYHVFEREELARLRPLLAAAVAHDLAAHPELAQVRVHLASLEKDLLAHFQMEERILFPAIRDTERGGPTPISLSTPQEQLRTISAEHQAVEELFLNIRTLSEDYAIPADAGRDLRALYLGLRTLEDDLHMHLYLENHLLYPRILPGEGW